VLDAKLSKSILLFKMTSDLFLSICSQRVWSKQFFVFEDNLLTFCDAKFAFVAISIIGVCVLILIISYLLARGS